MKFKQTAFLLIILLVSFPTKATAGDIFIQDSRANFNHDREIFVDTGRVRVVVPTNRSSVGVIPFRRRVVRRGNNCYGGRYVTSQHNRQFIHNGRSSVQSRVSTRCY